MKSIKLRIRHKNKIKLYRKEINRLKLFNSILISWHNNRKVKFRLIINFSIVKNCHRDL